MTWATWKKPPPRKSANIGFEVNLENNPPKLRIRQWRKIYRVKTSPKMTGIIEADVKYVHIHSNKTRDTEV